MDQNASHNECLFCSKGGSKASSCLLYVLALLCLLLSSCVASNLDNSFDLKNGGSVFGLILKDREDRNAASSQNGCKFDTDHFGSCQFAP